MTSESYPRISVFQDSQIPSTITRDTELATEKAALRAERLTWGTWAARPAASADNKGALYKATDIGDGLLFISDGTEWRFKGPQKLAYLSEPVNYDNTAAEQTVLNAAIPASFWYAGSHLRLFAWGGVDHRAVADTFTFRVKFGGVSFATVATADANVRDDREWQCEGLVGLGEVGVGGEVYIRNKLLHCIDNASTVATTLINGGATYPGSSVDTTAAHNFQFTVQMSNANAENEISVGGAFMEVINAGTGWDF